MNEAELKALAEKLGKDATDQLEKGWKALEDKTKEIATAAIKQHGGVTKEQFDSYQQAVDTAKGETERLLKEQGIDLAALKLQVSTGGGSIKSIAEVLSESNEKLKSVYTNGQGTMTFMVNRKASGEYVMAPFDVTSKAAGPTGTVGGLAGVGGNVSSITQSLDATTLLRMGGMAMINGQYRNRQWLFDLVNTVQAGWDMPFAIWFEETAVQGTAAVVAEGGTKPTVQYAYTLKSQPYKKAAQLVTFTEEFSLDFPRLQSDIMGKGRTDVLNIVNNALLTDLTAAATAYNTGATFSGGTGNITNVNDYDAIAAVAAQVDNATFASVGANQNGGARANTAIMSTFKEYRMGITKTTQGEYLNRPDVLDGITFVGNPAVGADNLIVGDLSQMTLILRGGFLIKIGYNGTDFAQNQFSVVMEQYYYDYIPAVRTPAIVKGPTFAAVKTAIS